LQTSSRGCFPNTHRAIMRCRKDKPLVRAPFHGSDRIRMAFEGLQASSALQVPYAYVKRTGKDALRILVPRQALHMRTVSIDHPQTTSGLDIPDTNRSIPGTRDGAPSIGRQQCAVCPVGVSFEDLQAFARVEIPHPDAAIPAVAAGSDGAPSIGA